MRMNKSGKTDTATYIAIAIFAIIALSVTGLVDFSSIKGALGGTAAAPIAPAQTGGFCAIEDTSYTYTLDDKYSSGTAVSTTSESVAIYVDDVKKDGAYTHSGDSLTLSPGQKVKAYLYLSTESNSNTDCNTHYWSFTVPCSGTLDQSIDVVDITTSPTVNILSDTFSDISRNSGATWDFSAGDSKAGTLKITGVNEKGYGATPESKLCVVFTGNKTEWKDIQWVGTGITKASCRPDGATTYQTDEEYWAYEVDRLEGVEVLDGSIALLAESTASPAAVNSDINITIYDAQYFLNLDNGLIELGYEDEDNNLIGAAEISDSIQIS